MPKKKVKLLFLVTEDWYFWRHWFSLARSARDAGFDVVVATRVNHHRALIEKEGIRVVPISMRRESVNPLREIGAIAELARLYADERPTLVHHVAIKPVLYGSVAAKIVGIPAANMLPGLGFIYTGQGWVGCIIRPLISLAYKTCLSLGRSKVIFPNPDDASYFVARGLVRSRDVVLIPGPGVNLSRFLPTVEPIGVPLVVLAGRMLWDKGVAEFVAASQLLKSEGVSARFALVGDTDPANPAAVPTRQLRQWNDSGVVEWWGHREDMPDVLARCHVVCLPSYREGLPRALVEAGASARPVVAADVPGCREVVRHGQNGFLVPARDSGALASALKALILDPELRRRMGESGRGIAEAEFSEGRAESQTLDAYRELLRTPA